MLINDFGFHIAHCAKAFLINLAVEMNETLTAEQYYLRGNKLRRQGEWAAAMNEYLQARELDPDGPATVALEMLQQIMNYRNTDLLNP